MLCGWAPDVCLKMPAKRFFAIVKAAREREDRVRNIWFYNLVDIAACGQANTDFIKNLKGHFYSQLGATKTVTNREAAMILNTIFAQNKGGKK